MTERLGIEMTEGSLRRILGPEFTEEEMVLLATAINALWALAETQPQFHSVINLTIHIAKKGTLR